MEGDTAVDSIKIKTISIKIKAQSFNIVHLINISPCFCCCALKNRTSSGAIGQTRRI